MPRTRLNRRPAATATDHPRGLDRVAPWLALLLLSGALMLAAGAASGQTLDENGRVSNNELGIMSDGSPIDDPAPQDRDMGIDDGTDLLDDEQNATALPDPLDENEDETDAIGATPAPGLDDESPIDADGAASTTLD